LRYAPCARNGDVANRRLTGDEFLCSLYRAIHLIDSFAPAIANAIAWSTGARIKSLPLTPEKVWRALKEVANETKNPGI
jgi:hypothetical protein